MDKNKHYKVALVLYTHGLDYDDRIRKEILSIQKLYSNVSFKIFAVEPKNREEDGTSSYGVPYRVPYLKSRDKYAGGTHILAKAWDFYKTIKSDLNSFDAVWCADPETFIFVLMLHGKPIDWDLHELPLVFMGNPIKRQLFRYLESKCNVMIHANESRLKHLEKIGMIRFPDKQFFLRNYPQFNEIDDQYDELYQRFIEWKGDSKCAYLQGLNDDKRAAYESVKAVMSYNGLKGVVVGGFEDAIKNRLVDEFGNESIEEKIFFTGRIKQLKTPQYIRQCHLSLVFYKNTSPNNWYCEPNRLFQSVNNGVPVLVGNNPPLKSFIKENSFGTFVETDGSDVQKIVEGIDYICANYEMFNQMRSSFRLSLWDSQDNTIAEIVNSFLR